jgi:hypothetical protein
MVLVVVGLLFYFDTTLCPSAGLLGHPCPSCGLTRATVALASGHPSQAYTLHPGVFLVWPYLLVAGLYWLRGGGRTYRRWLGVVGLALLSALVLLWGARFAGYFGGPVPVHPWSALLRATFRAH